MFRLHCSFSFAVNKPAVTLHSETPQAVMHSLRAMIRRNTVNLAFVYYQRDSTNWMIIMALTFIKQYIYIYIYISNDITSKLRSSFTAMYLQNCKVNGKRLCKYKANGFGK